MLLYQELMLALCNHVSDSQASEIVSLCQAGTVSVTELLITVNVLQGTCPSPIEAVRCICLLIRIWTFLYPEITVPDWLIKDFPGLYNGLLAIHNVLDLPSDLSSGLGEGMLHRLFSPAPPFIPLSPYLEAIQELFVEHSEELMALQEYEERLEN